MHLFDHAHLHLQLKTKNCEKAKVNIHHIHLVIGSIMPTLLGNKDGIQNTSENEAKQQPRKSLETFNPLIEVPDEESQDKNRCIH